MSPKTKHGESRRNLTTEYATWEAMIRRCHSASHPAYKLYGARDIVVCDRWRTSYENFLADMGRRPYKTTIERDDNDGPYSPDNCRWATRKEQSNNTRRNRFITFNGETLTHTGWAEKLGGEASLIKSRLQRGWTEADAVTRPINQKFWIARRAS